MQDSTDGGKTMDGMNKVSKKRFKRFLEKKAELEKKLADKL